MPLLFSKFVLTQTIVIEVKGRMDDRMGDQLSGIWAIMSQVLGHRARCQTELNINEGSYIQAIVPVAPS